MIAVTCPHCKQCMPVPESQVGMKRCAKCSKIFFKVAPRVAHVNHDDFAGFLPPQSPAVPSQAPSLLSIPVPAATPPVRALVPNAQERSSQPELQDIGAPPLSLATQVKVVIQQPKQQSRMRINRAHLILTLVTGGGWLPIWIIYSLCEIYLPLLTLRFGVSRTQFSAPAES